MNESLATLARELRLDDDAMRPLRLAFGLACVQRIEHLLEHPRAVAGLATLRSYVAGDAGEEDLQAATEELGHVANQHRGSNSIDGAAHAAVSATYAVANALAGKAVDAAGYAAYATVYAYGGYAVNDRTAFEPEFTWQVQQLRRMAGGS